MSYYKNNIDLNDYINDDINIIEIFFCKKQDISNIINVIADEDIDTKIEERYKKSRDEKYKSYFMKDKIYTYELSNDNQYVTSKIKKLSKYIVRKNMPQNSDLYIIASKIDKYPQYTFPCTNNIDNISEYSIKEYKISNRISIIIRTDDEKTKTLSVEYRHSLNVEIDKMNEIINKIVRLNC